MTDARKLDESSSEEEKAVSQQSEEEEESGAEDEEAADELEAGNETGTTSDDNEVCPSRAAYTILGDISLKPIFRGSQEVAGKDACER